ncbi:unnamed protein product [Caenorhabditis auriculariae]|uniref:DnaJ-like protein C11 C-terminal domain-containing protein n=1 Tax=Caenorhabditis auriculariae TaxID=2777116 RepID=A0A8S1HHW2_9PELO|nr:unnamed protein product [Caenorhabditis auriculariae]
MSLSSGDSLCGDDEDADFLLDEEEEIDFYAILNVPRDANEEDIIKSLSKKMLNIRRAHEVLMDPKKRAIYDALGVQGLDTQGWELVSRSANPDSIRREYEFLQRLKERELMLQRVHPTSAFIMKTSLTGLFHEQPEDRYPPQFVGIALTQSVDCAFTGIDRLGLVGRVKTGNGRGDGNVSAIWKRAAGQFNVENTVTLSPDSAGWAVRVARNVFKRAAVIVQPQLTYSFLHEALVPSVLLSNIILNFSPIQSAITTTMVHTAADTHQPKAVVSLTLAPTNSNVRLVYYRRQPERDSFTEASVQMTTFGIAPALTVERRLTRYSRVGVSLQFAFPSCLLSTKFKLKTGQSSFEWQCVLCDDKDALARSVIYGVVAPYFLVQVTKYVFRSWWDKAASMITDEGRDGEREVDSAKREEAANVVSLMRSTADRIRREEQSRHGVIILEARYGQSAPGATKAYPMADETRTIDVAVPLQAMVNDSQLRVYATAKHQLPGFYDPCPGEAKKMGEKMQAPTNPPGYDEAQSSGEHRGTSAPAVEAEVFQQNHGNDMQGQPTEMAPPPSYQAAMSYPAAPTYGGIEQPKPMVPQQPPIYYQQPPPFITQTRLPQPNDAVVQAIRANVAPTTANVVVHIQQGIQCRHCHAGVVTRQTDMCCLLCLVLLTIFTFPLGLIFLCCVPCTVQNRCSNCQRLA